jgi:hypothetical protein
MRLGPTRVDAEAFTGKSKRPPRRAKSYEATGKSAGRGLKVPREQQERREPLLLAVVFTGRATQSAISVQNTLLDGDQGDITGGLFRRTSCERDEFSRGK